MNWHSKAWRKLDRGPDRYQGKQAPVEVDLSAGLLIVRKRGSAMLGEGEIGMTEKLLGNRLMNRGIDDFCLSPRNTALRIPLPSRDASHSDSTSALPSSYK